MDLKKKTRREEIQCNELHALCRPNYELTLQNEESLYEELFSLPSSLHFYDNTFISALVASAVFSTEKPLQLWENSSTVEPIRQSVYVSRKIDRK